jgi:hypothetical protein|tara:strand:+ start:2388 stop:2543 length:156 start_codon:yes stop_codon:yes gene_type:complete
VFKDFVLRLSKVFKELGNKLEEVLASVTFPKLLTLLKRLKSLIVEEFLLLE